MLKRKSEGSRRMAVRGAALLLATLMAAVTLVATSDRAEAAVPSGKAVCYSNMIDVSPPAAGQKWTYLSFYFWNGTKWSHYFGERFNGPIISGSGMHNDADRVFMAPRGKYIAVKAWGYYPGKGWVSYPMGHGYQLSRTFTGAYCRA